MLLFSLIVIPISFAADNTTAILSYETANVTDAVSIPLEDNALAASNDYYFDASAESDGNGSISSPYKYLKAEYIKENSNLYFANGQYNLDKAKTIQEVNIIGSDVDRTIIKYDGPAFTVSNQFTVKNVTFMDLSITNNAKFTASNVIFEEGYGSRPDSYGNNWGGAIYTPDGYENAYVNVDNCTFKNNYAVYGGAIYIGAGNLNVSNSLFFNNYAYNYGGAIACDYASSIFVSKSKFYNSRSQEDAGGSIYIRDASKFTADHIDISNSSATFGGALTTLNTTVSLSYVNMTDNSAKYDGGAIFHMYGGFTMSYSRFINNSAKNGGAIFIDNSTNAIFMRNTFTDNKATDTGGAIYSILNKFNPPLPRNNHFNSNTAAHGSDYYDSSSINLTIGNGNYTMYKGEVNPISSLPSRYSLIDDGYVTSVKDQQTSGNCWAFTALAVLESCILKATGETLDLSEENMKNIIAMYSDYGWKMDTNEGGYDNMPWGYLAGWLGPVDETDDLFDDKSTLSPILNSIIHVQNIKFLKRSSFTDNDEIKRAVLNYGAVGTGMYFSGYYLNTRNFAYYYMGTGGNHAVTIVGWDDTYSKYNFKHTPQGDGAWIVRNSWDSSWGNDGYFYVSYYDTCFAAPNVEASAYTFILNDTIRFDRNYQYDIAGMTDYFYKATSNALYKNRFTSTCDEYLAAVSTYFEKATNWTATVLVNDEIKDALSGISASGYYTFNLNKFIPVKSGDVFEVIFNITTSGDVGVPISEIYSLNKLVYAPGVSYISWDGVNWFDLYNLTGSYSTHPYNSGVACIKAFTYLNPINTLTNLTIDFKQDGLSNISARIYDEFGNLVKYGNVTFNINGENRTVSVENGVAKLSYGFNKKVNSISASFDATGYNSSSNMTSYNLPKIDIEWTLNITRVFNNVNITVTANKPLNESIIMNINGENLPFNLTNGTNTLTIMNLANNLYSVHVSLSDDSDYSAGILSGEFVIEMHNTKIISSSLNATDDGAFAFNITLLDENDNAVSNRQIIFTVNNSTFVNTTDNNGQAIVYIKLDKGVYDIASSFNGDNSYFASNATDSINVKGKIWIDVNVNVYSNNAFINVFGSNRINETFTVLVNNRPHNATSKDGVATLKLFDLANDVYNVKVSLNESEYEFNEAETQFTINIADNVQIESSIEISGDDAIINIEIGDVSGDVNVIVDGNSNVYQLSGGKANHTVKDISAGNHTLIIIYENKKFKSEIFTVPKRQSSIELSFDNIKVGEKATISVDVPQKATGMVSIDINGTLYMVNLSKTDTLDLIFDRAGNYSLVATYCGDYNYESSKSQEYTLIVADKKRANISIDVPDDVKVGDEILIGITSDTDAQLAVTINGEVQSIIYANGPLGLSLYDVLKATNGKVKYVPLKGGIYNITVIAGENEEYAGETVTKVFEATKKEAILTVSPIADAKVGDKVTISVVNETDGALTIKVNTEKVTGEYEITKAGTYTITVESIETDEYKAGFTTYAFNVAEEPVGPGNITVVIDGKEYIIPAVNGTAIETGMDDELAEANEKIKNLTGELADANKKVDDLIGELEEAKVNATNLADELADANGKVENLTGELEEAKVNATNLAEDLADANKKVDDLTGELEEAKVNATNLAEDLADSNKKVDDLTGELEEAKVNATNLSEDLADANNKVDDLTSELEEAQANATKLENDLADANQTIEDLIKQLEEAKANATNTTVPEAVVVDGVEYPIEYVNGTATVETNKTEPVIPKSSEFSEITISDDLTISIVLKDSDGNVIAVAPIAFTVNGVVQTTTTDKDGKFTVKGENGALITINYAGDANITGTNTTLKLNRPAVPEVVKIASQFNVSNRAITINGYAVDGPAGEQGIYYATTLLDANGNPISNVYMEFAVNNKIYNRTTYENGSFNPYKLNMIRAGRYTMAFNFAGDENYTNAFACVCVDLDKKPITIKASAKSYKASVKTKKYTVSLSTIPSVHDGKVYLSPKLVTLTVNGKTYTGKTNDNGQVTFKITNLNKKGKYTADISYKGDKTYEEAVKSVKLTVK